METSADDTASTRVDTGEFGPNIWVVDQMYRRYLDAPDSVSEAWREFFADYRPADLHSAAPDTASTPTPTAAAAPTASPVAPEAPSTDEIVPLRGGAAVIVDRMEASRDIPTATSVRTLPSKLLEVNRLIINNQLGRLTMGGKVSFTHLIGWAVVKALGDRPAMNVAYRVVDGKPHQVRYGSVNLGLAVDVPRKDGTRTLLVPNIKRADEMDFRQFWLAYEDIIRWIRAGEITPEDFAGTTATLTNPGTVGTVQSVPRLMPDQGVIIGVGAIGFPPEYEGSDPISLALNGIGKVITITSTYDHRVIQGAESGMVLRRIHELLLGDGEFYDGIFAAMGIPYVPARWAVDSNPPPGSRPWAEKQARVFNLINMYRVRGHLIADLDPLRMKPPAIHSELDPLSYGLTIWDLEREFATGGLGGHERMALGKILGLLRDAYCRTTGLEYMHIQEPDQKAWIQQRIEGASDDISAEDKQRIIQKLNEAEAFEEFLHKKYLGQKRFSLEGAEGLIPLFDAVLNSAADAGMREATVGMAHRGRLNVLANIVRKGYGQIFREFEDQVDLDRAHGSGDVKYHMGAHGTHTSPLGAQLEIDLVSNPSHLEAVDPILEGTARARQDLIGPGAEDLVLPILVHGDAAFSGQGVVAETLNLSQLSGYHTGGTIHIVVNNQVGFTTSAEEARSSFYASDAAKAIQAPIVHVNGDDPEALVRAARLAFAFRQAFHKDIVIDMRATAHHGSSTWSGSSTGGRCPSRTAKRYWPTSTSCCRPLSTTRESPRRKPYPKHRPPRPTLCQPPCPEAGSMPSRRPSTCSPTGSRSTPSWSASSTSAAPCTPRASPTGPPPKPSGWAHWCWRATGCAWRARTPGGARSAIATP
jgi:2-oxoglutarate dehydrogenase E1 component